MKVWILELMAVLLVALPHHFMANSHDIYPLREPKPIIEKNASDEGWNVNFAATESVVIVGLNRLCLEVYRFAPKLVTCKANATEQKWRFHDDGTIRPEKDPLKCLTSNELSRRGVVLIIQCRFSSSAYTVWKYRSSDSSIVNPKSNLVLDLSESKVNSPDAQIFILYSSNGGNNQKWHLEPRSPQLSLL